MPSSTTSSRPHTASVERYFSRPANYLAKDFNVRIRRDIVGDILRGTPPCHVLDVGCGDGRIGAILLSRGHRVTFLDPEPAMLALARKNASDSRAAFIEGTLGSISSDSRYGVVLCLGLLAHVTSVQETLASISRVALPEAQIIIQITDTGSLVGTLNSRYVAWRERHLSGYGYALNEISLTNLMRGAAQCGLELEQTYRYSLVLPGMMRILPNALLYALAVISRVWPLKLIGGEIIALFRHHGATPEREAKCS